MDLKIFQRKYYRNGKAVSVDLTKIINVTIKDAILFFETFKKGESFFVKFNSVSDAVAEFNQINYVFSQYSISKKKNL